MRPRASAVPEYQSTLIATFARRDALARFPRLSACLFMCAPKLSSSLSPTNDLSARGFSQRGPGPTRSSSVCSARLRPRRGAPGPEGAASSRLPTERPLGRAPAEKRVRTAPRGAARRYGVRAHDHVRAPGRRPQRGPRSGGQRPPDFLAGRQDCRHRPRSLGQEMGTMGVKPPCYVLPLSDWDHGGSARSSG